MPLGKPLASSRVRKQLELEKPCVAESSSRAWAGSRRWAEHRDGLAAAAGRRIGRGPDDAVRRQQLPHADLGRSAATSTLPISAKTRSAGSTRGGTRGSPSAPPSRPWQDAGLDEDERRSDAMFGVYLGSGEGQQDFDRFTRMMVRGLTADGFDVAQFTKAGLELLNPICRAGAGAEHAGRPPGGAVQRPGAQRQLPDGLRRQQPGDRRGGRDDPPRRRRRDALRRHAQHDPSVRRHGLQPADGAVDQQRRADQGLAPLRPQPRRLRARRRGRHGDPRGAGARPTPRREDPRARSSATARRPTPSASPTRIPRAAAPRCA